ncbi:MAG: efflux RND transporter periplasmic adaptor subunit [Gemmatimonadetes bacterium]|nr:efflux RND transporter periplasmic adaptor subunit [Gemmatimonadota bacterium]
MAHALLVVTMGLRARLFLLSLGLAACGHEVQTDAAAPAADTMAAGSAGAAADAAAGAQLMSVLYSEHDAEVTARMDGVVRALAVELGDRAAPGQILAVLEDDAEAAAVEAARADVGLAQAEHDRAVTLREQDVISQAELEKALYRLKAAEAALRSATVAHGYTRIRAPFAGIVSQRFVRLGQSVTEGDPLFRITALRPLRVRVRVPEAEASGLSVQQSLRVRSIAGEEVAGLVARIAPTVDPASGTVEVLVDIPAPGALRPGSSVTVDLPAQPASRAERHPSTSLGAGSARRSRGTSPGAPATPSGGPP